MSRRMGFLLGTCLVLCTLLVGALGQGANTEARYVPFESSHEFSMCTSWLTHHPAMSNRLDRLGEHYVVVSLQGARRACLEASSSFAP